MTGLDLRKRKISKKPPTWNEIEQKKAVEGKESTKDFLKRMEKKLKERKLNNEVQKSGPEKIVDNYKNKRNQDNSR